MKKIMNQFGKEDFFSLYIVLVDHAKSYDSITRFKMRDAIIDFFENNTEAIPQFLDLEKIRMYKNHEVPQYLTFYDLFFFDKDQDGNFILLPYFETWLKKSKISKELEELNDYRTIVKGMLNVYGVITYDNINKVYETIRPKKYSSLSLPKLEELRMLRIRLLIDGSDVYNNVIMQRPDDEIDVAVDFEIEEMKVIYSFDYYFTFGDTGMVPDFIDYFESNFMERIIITHGLSSVDEPVTYLRMILRDETISEDLKNVYSNWPLWGLGGLTYNEFEKQNISKKLDPDKYVPFQQMITDLAEYANKVYKYITLDRNESLIGLIDAEAAYMIIKLATSNEGFIEEFIQSKSYEVLEHTDEMINGLKNAIFIEEGYGYKYIDDLLCVYSEGNVYHVKGISHGIDLYFPSSVLPMKVSMILIPLYDSISYILTIESDQSDSSISARMTMNKLIRKAKHIYKYSDLLDLS